MFFSQHCSLVRPRRAAATGGSQRGPHAPTPRRRGGVSPPLSAPGESSSRCAAPPEQPGKASAKAVEDGGRGPLCAPARPPPARPHRAGNEPARHGQRSRGTQALHDGNLTGKRPERGRRLCLGTGRTAALGTRTPAPRLPPRRPLPAMGNGMSQVMGSTGAAALQGRPCQGGLCRRWRWETLAWRLALPRQAAFHLLAPDPAQGSAVRQLVYLLVERNQRRCRQGCCASRQPGLVPTAARGVWRAGVTASPLRGKGGIFPNVFKPQAPAPEHAPGALCDPKPSGPAPPRSVGLGCAWGSASLGGGDGHYFMVV